MRISRLVKLYLVISFVACGQAVSAQYTVTKIIGRVLNSNGEAIRPGSRLTGKEQLKFTSARDAVFLIETGKGSLKISPAKSTPDAKGGNNVLIDLIKSAVHLQSQTRELSGRGADDDKIPGALKADIAINPHVTITPVNKYYFNNDQYNTRAGGYFMLIETIAGKTVSTRLKTRKDTLLLNYADFINAAAVSCKLSFHSGTANSDELVALFIPYFDLSNETGLMIKTLVNDLKPIVKEKNALYRHVYAEVYETIGKPNPVGFDNDFDRYYQNGGDITKPVKYYLGLTNDASAGTGVPVISASLTRGESDLPESFSLRKYAPPVGNQGQYGTCAAWSTAYAARSIANAVNNQPEDITAFSPTFLYNQVKSKSDVNCEDGLNIAYALSYMKGAGVLPRSGDFECGRLFSPQEVGFAKSYAIKDFQALCGIYKVTPNVVFDMKQLLAAKKPLVIGMYVPQSFMEVTKTQTGGVWYPRPQDYADVNAARATNGYGNRGHAICVTGYNDNINGGSFEIMNSWGTGYANDGFVWVNYEDFARFVREIYVINDFEGGNTQKLDLKGDMEFQLFKDDQLRENIGVTKEYVDLQGTKTAMLPAGKSAFVNYRFTADMHSGADYKIKFHTQTPCYIYILGRDASSAYKIFPHPDVNESALVDYSNASVILPDKANHITLDTTTGVEKMCVLVSKSPLNYEGIIAAAAKSANIYECIKDQLGDNALDTQEINAAAHNVEFSSKVHRKNVLAFFIEFNHVN